jgi:hypothetical protein
MRCNRAYATLVAANFAVVSCDSPASVAGVQHIPPQSGTVTLAASVRVVADTVGIIVGEARRVTIQARDQTGASISTDDASVRSSDPSVVSITDGSIVPVQDGRTGRIWRELVPILRFVAPGTATVYATLNGASDSVVLIVRPHPRASKSLVVDSFTVVEYRAQCAWACPYLVYAPLLKLRDSTAHTSVEVVSVEFAIGARTTGVCRGSRTYTPGLSAHLNWIADYLWSNDLIFVSLDGAPFSETIATAHVIAREADGSYSQVDATAPVQRMVSNPQLPTSSSSVSDWNCN